MGDTMMTVRDNFFAALDFDPDRFQLESCDAIDRGENVVVAAPTGAGKTLVAAYAVAVTLSRGQRIFYTTPIKALSNQKYQDLCVAHGRANVGLLTGDNNINGDAPVVVMTTEVLRNMLYAGSTLDGLQSVVLDEVHYLQDAYRGLVWEEVIIHLPRSVKLISLSATVSNAEELAGWIRTVRGATALVTESRRPVELTNHYVVGERGGSKLHMVKTLNGGDPNSKGFRFDPPSGGRRSRQPHRKGARGGGKRPPQKWRAPRRDHLVRSLAGRDLLPAIFFIFSRAGCDDAAEALSRSGQLSVSDRERRRITEIVSDHTSQLSPSDLEILGYRQFLASLHAGVAAHHAGMVPPMKEAVEACFLAGLIKVVFATETLALGVNMPARTVVIEKLTKYNGEGHEFLTPAQYTQLTGRAGRRGIDTAGHAVVLWSPYVEFEKVAELAASRKYTLTSSFRPTYNMAANLIRRYTPERSRQLLNLSFGQYRSNTEVVELERRLERLDSRRRKAIGDLERNYGSIEALRAKRSMSGVRANKSSNGVLEEVTSALATTKPGDVIQVRIADEDGETAQSVVAVLSVAYRKKGRIRVAAVDRDGQKVEFTASDVDQPPVNVGHVELPQPYLPASVSYGFEVAALLTRARVGANDEGRSRQATSSGPGRHGDLNQQPASSEPVRLDDSAVRALQRLERIEAEIDRHRRSTAKAVDSLATLFDRVIELLTDRGHVDGWSLTESGELIARLYHETDLVVVEALEQGVFDGLDPAGVAALASVFVYEERSSATRQPWFPSKELRRRHREVVAIHLAVSSSERSHRLPESRGPDAGFLAAAHGWACGGSLEDVLADEDFTAGDFVRVARQLIDLLRQLGQLAQSPATAKAARRAAESLNRDLVAASSQVTNPVDDDD